MLNATDAGVWPEVKMPILGKSFYLQSIIAILLLYVLATFAPESMQVDLLQRPQYWDLGLCSDVGIDGQDRLWVASRKQHPISLWSSVDVATARGRPSAPVTPLADESEPAPVSNLGREDSADDRGSSGQARPGRPAAPRRG